MIDIETTCGRAPAGGDGMTPCYAPGTAATTVALIDACLAETTREQRRRDEPPAQAAAA